MQSACTSPSDWHGWFLSRLAAPPEVAQDVGVQFWTTVELEGKTATGLVVPDAVVEALAAGRRPAVTVTIGDHVYRTTVTPMGGRFLVPLSAENRRAVGVAAGDRVSVEISPDTAPREVAVPDDLSQALTRDLLALEFFNGLAYTHPKEWVRWIEEAKKAETRDNRVRKTVAVLHAGKRTH